MSDSFPVFSLDEETKKLFSQTRDLLDQILETFEILEDQELMGEIKKANKEYKEGKSVSLEEYKEGKRTYE